jgi:Ca-activated chloride channel family protein
VAWAPQPRGQGTAPGFAGASERNVVELEQIGPGRYHEGFPTTQEGVYLAGMARRRADEMVGSQLAGAVVPYGQEFRDLGEDEALLRELSEMTGGVMLSEPKQA